MKSPCFYIPTFFRFLFTLTIVEKDKLAKEAYYLSFVSHVNCLNKHHVTNFGFITK